MKRELNENVDLAAETLLQKPVSTRRNDAIIDASSILAAEPALANQKSDVVNLVWEEYIQRRQAGEQIDLERFCERFPFHQSIMRRIQTDLAISEDPSFIEDLDEALWPAIGEDFLGYRIEKLLGIGAIARVYLARETQIGNRLVTLKVAEFTGQETDLLGRIKHPHIVEVYSTDSDEERQLSYFCMPFVGVATLGDVFQEIRQRGGRVPIEPSFVRDVAHRAYVAVAGASDKSPAPSIHDDVASPLPQSYTKSIASVGYKIATALIYLHDRDISHQDLKPANVLLTSEGDPLLLDFNLSIEREQDFPCMGGTLPYMAPERLAEIECQKIGHFAPKSDIFSLGVVLYQLLTGRSPFCEPSHRQPRQAGVAFMLDAQRQPITRIRKLNPNVAPSLASVVESCLAISPDLRPDAHSLAEQLRECAKPTVAVTATFSAGKNLAVTFVLAAMIAIFSFGIADRSKDTNVERLTTEGARALSNNDLGLALRCFQLAANIAPKHRDAWVGQAAVHYRNANWDLAASTFKKATERGFTGQDLAVLTYIRRMAGEPTRFDQTVAEGYAPGWVMINFIHPDMSFPTPSLSLLSAGTKAMQLCPKDPLAYSFHINRVVDMAGDARRRLLPNDHLATIESALKHCGDDPHVQLAVARFYAWAASSTPEQTAAFETLCEHHLAKAAELGIEQMEIRRSSPISAEYRNRYLSKGSPGEPSFPFVSPPANVLKEVFRISSGVAARESRRERESG